MNTKFFFRPVKVTAAKFAEIKASFEKTGTEFEEIRAESAVEGQPGKLEAIKRKPLEAELPTLTVEDYAAIDPKFVQSVLDDQMKSAVQKQFVDELKPIDVAVINAKWIIDSLASQRAAAINADDLKEFAEYVKNTLTAAQTKQGTIDIIVDMVSKRFSKQVLNAYVRFSDSYDALLLKAIGTLEGAPDNVVAGHLPVIEALQANLAAWQEAQNVDVEEELDL